MNFERETSEALLLEPPRAETFLNSWVTSNPKTPSLVVTMKSGFSLAVTSRTSHPICRMNASRNKHSVSFCVMFATCALVQCQQLSKWINNAVNRIFRSNILLDFP